MNIFNSPQSLLDAINSVILTEHELTRREVEKTSNVFGNEIAKHREAASAISGSAFPEGKDRIVVPLESAMTDAQSDVENHIHSKGYHSTNYLAGTTRDAHDRDVSIGKALTKTHAPQSLIDRYATHQQVVAKNPESNNLQVVISKNPHDVIGMSQGTEWGKRPSEMHANDMAQQSCMRFGTHQFDSHMANELKAGTHVAWLTHKGDDEAKEPIARITLRPFKEHNAQAGELNLKIHEADAHETYGYEFPLSKMHSDVQDIISDIKPGLHTEFTHKDNEGNYVYRVHGSTNPERHASDINQTLSATPGSIMHAEYKEPEKKYKSVMMYLHKNHPIMRNAREFAEDMAADDFGHNRDFSISHYVNNTFDPEFSEEAQHIKPFSHIDYEPQHNQGDHHAFVVKFQKNSPIAKGDLKEIKRSFNAVNPDKLHPITMLPHEESELPGIESSIKTVLVPGKKIYGKHSDAFINTVNKWTQKNTPMETGKRYVMSPGIYSDNDVTTIDK